MSLNTLITSRIQGDDPSLQTSLSRPKNRPRKSRVYRGVSPFMPRNVTQSRYRSYGASGYLSASHTDYLNFLPSMTFTVLRCFLVSREQRERLGNDHIGGTHRDRTRFIAGVAGKADSQVQSLPNSSAQLPRRLQCRFRRPTLYSPWESNVTF